MEQKETVMEMPDYVINKLLKEISVLKVENAKLEYKLIEEMQSKKRKEEKTTE